MQGWRDQGFLNLIQLSTTIGFTMLLRNFENDSDVKKKGVLKNEYNVNYVGSVGLLVQICLWFSMWILYKLFEWIQEPLIKRRFQLKKSVSRFGRNKREAKSHATTIFNHTARLSPDRLKIDPKFDLFQKPNLFLNE